MNDRLKKTASSLAIVEKKPQKLGGCVGIFFQLFDWNGRFAKKKLFSKILLQPVRLKQASKKFGGDENQPKLRLIADKNSGGFPSSRKTSGVSNVDLEQKREMRAPGLVARLMGLESMPALQREKTKKAPVSANGNDRADKIEDKCRGYKGDEGNMGKGGSKNELRPQKLQKTGLCERQPVARMGAEVFQFTNVLSRSRKHPPKLTSPVKSPRTLSGKNASRIIGAATRILEPGLARTRSKRALAYSNTLRNSSNGETFSGITTDILPSQVEDSKYLVTQQPKGQSSCRTCGHLLDKLDSDLSVDERTMVFTSGFSHHVEASCQRSERSSQGMPTFEEVLEECPVTAGSAAKKFQPRSTFSSNRNPLSGETRWNLGSQQCKPQKDMPLSDDFSSRTQSQNQISQVRNRVPPRSKFNGLLSNKASASIDVDDTKDCVFNHRSLSRHRKPGLSTGADNGKFEMERRAGYGKNDSILPVRKRRPINNARESASPVFTSCFDKQTYTGAHVMSRKEMECNVQSINRQSKNRLNLHQDRRTVGVRKVDSDVLFTVNSPVKQSIGIRAGFVKRGIQNDSSHEITLQKISLNESDENTRYKKPFPLSGDALGALLEQKLQELNLQMEDEMGIGGNAPRKSTAMILLELISALTSERAFQNDDSAATSNGKRDSRDCGDMSYSKILANSQVKAKTAELLVDCLPDSEHLSPGSVLEASYSSESGLSSSMDDSSRYKMLTETLDCPYDDPPSLGRGTDLLDSATSEKIAKSGREYIIDVHEHISEVLCCMELANCGLSGSMLDYAKKVLLNVKLVFGNATSPASIPRQGFSIKNLFLYQLETLASVLQMNLDCFLNIKDGKEVNQLRRFTFDSVIEYLDSRFGQYAKSGFKVLTKLPFFVNTEMLIFDIVEEVRRWGESSGLIYDELIEKEMSDSLGQWTDFDIEKFELGIQIAMHLFQILVDEIVVELWNCRPNSPSIAQGFH
ncbi:Hypothetical predicted protein [Olea europaea subsp. europaea]|uniref:DUF4378 domain-containing protein n=1 Tax=Olea europaea subsp. europaea TaxID=158383 RepID=A0A8S0PNW5_OLEEU|nr:Hypothetical predicted protein [Olea europaea subsp. europaea]